MKTALNSWQGAYSCTRDLIFFVQLAIFTATATDDYQLSLGEDWMSRDCPLTGHPDGIFIFCGQVFAGCFTYVSLPMEKQRRRCSIILH